jgi:predicted HD phosphohydrolase
MNTMDIAQFEREPYCHDAVTLRKIDEIAKDPHAPEYAFEEFRDAVTRAAQAVMPH